MYFDYAATTPLNPEVKKYIIDILDDYGNPSSAYNIGYKTKSIINKARENVRNFINAESTDNIIFTSSGSASNTLAIKGLTKTLDKYILYYSPIAHKSMTYACKSCLYNHELKINKYGEIDLQYLSDILSHNNDTPIICIEAANSEIGLVRYVKKIAQIVHEYNGIVVVDFTGYIHSYKVDVQKLDVDIATFSGHKLGALKGIGVLYRKENIQLSPLIYGSQEYGLFAGTENVIGIASIGKAVEIYDYSSISAKNRDYVCEQLLKIKKCYLVGSLLNRLPHNLYMCFQGVDGNNLVSMLDLHNIQVSTGSACNNYSKTPSETLLKIGIKEKDIHSCVRLSLSGSESKEDLDYLCKTIKECVKFLRTSI